jgi:hypothetical protein
LFVERAVETRRETKGRPFWGEGKGRFVHIQKGHVKKGARDDDEWFGIEERGRERGPPDSQPAIAAGIEVKAEAEAEECAICLDDMPRLGAGGSVLLACSHAFHAVCLDRWKDKCLEKGLHFTCAMCRRPAEA